jgi:hypothetical protein
MPANRFRPILFKDGRLQPGVEGIASVKEAEKTVTIETGSGHYAFELTGR